MLDKIFFLHLQIFFYSSSRQSVYRLHLNKEREKYEKSLNNALELNALETYNKEE